MSNSLCAAHKASLSFTISWSLLKLMSFESMMPLSHLILCSHFLFWPLNFLSIRVFSNVVAHCIRYPKYWSFSFSISPSNEHPGLMSFRIDLFDLLSRPRDSQESFLAPQFESIKSLVLSLLYSPAFASLHEYWKDQYFFLYGLYGPLFA